MSSKTQEVSFSDLSEFDKTKLQKIINHYIINQQELQKLKSQYKYNQNYYDRQIAELSIQVQDLQYQLQTQEIIQQQKQQNEQAHQQNTYYQQNNIVQQTQSPIVKIIKLRRPSSTRIKRNVEYNLEQKAQVIKKQPQQCTTIAPQQQIHDNTEQNAIHLTNNPVYNLQILQNQIGNRLGTNYIHHGDVQSNLVQQYIDSVNYKPLIHKNIDNKYNININNVNSQRQLLGMEYKHDQQIPSMYTPVESIKQLTNEYCCKTIQQEVEEALPIYTNSRINTNEMQKQQLSDKVDQILFQQVNVHKLKQTMEHTRVQQIQTYQQNKQDEDEAMKCIQQNQQQIQQASSGPNSNDFQLVDIESQRQQNNIQQSIQNDICNNIQNKSVVNQIQTQYQVESLPQVSQDQYINPYNQYQSLQQNKQQFNTKHQNTDYKQNSSILQSPNEFSQNNMYQTPQSCNSVPIKTQVVDQSKVQTLMKMIEQKEQHLTQNKTFIASHNEQQHNNKLQQQQEQIPMAMKYNSSNVYNLYGDQILKQSLYNNTPQRRSTLSNSDHSQQNAQFLKTLNSYNQKSQKYQEQQLKIQNEVQKIEKDDLNRILGFVNDYEQQ